MRNCLKGPRVVFALSRSQMLPRTTISIRSLDWDRDRFDIEFGCASLLTAFLKLGGRLAPQADP